MAADTDRQEEQEEAVFTSGAVVGTEGFIRRIVTSEEEVFPTGHKTPPVRFTVGDNKLKALRNLHVLRKRYFVHGVPMEALLKQQGRIEYRGSKKIGGYYAN